MSAAKFDGGLFNRNLHLRASFSLALGTIMTPLWLNYFLAVKWFLAISSGKGGLDGWRLMASDDTGTDLWTVAGAWEELEGGGVAV